MRGLRIVPATGTASRPGRSIPYDFADLVAPIGSRIAKLHWAATGTIVFSAHETDDFPDDESLERYFVEPVDEDADSPIWERAWLKPGCLTTLAPFIDGDWTDIVGLENHAGLLIANVDPRDTGWLDDHASVYFTCVDSAFWAVFSSDPDILASLRERFPQSKDMELDDRWW